MCMLYLHIPIGLFAPASSESFSHLHLATSTLQYHTLHRHPPCRRRPSVLSHTRRHRTTPTLSRPCPTFLQSASPPHLHHAFLLTQPSQYTEHLPSQLTRALTLIRSQRLRAEAKVAAIHADTTTYSRLPTLDPTTTTSAVDLRKNVSYALEEAERACRIAVEEARRLDETCAREAKRLDVVVGKLRAQPLPPSRDATPAALPVPVLEGIEEMLEPLEEEPRLPEPSSNIDAPPPAVAVLPSSPPPLPPQPKANPATAEKRRTRRPVSRGSTAPPKPPSPPPEPKRASTPATAPRRLRRLASQPPVVIALAPPTPTLPAHRTRKRPASSSLEPPARRPSLSADDQPNKRRRTRESRRRGVHAAVNPDGTETKDPDEPVGGFCMCNGAGDEVGDDMVGCDGEHCEHQWFHLGCVGLVKPPRGAWFCAECKAKMGT